VVNIWEPHQLAAFDQVRAETEVALDRWICQDRIVNGVCGDAASLIGLAETLADLPPTLVQSMCAVAIRRLAQLSASDDISTIQEG
jgi:hypothetical protein